MAKKKKEPQESPLTRLRREIEANPVPKISDFGLAFVRQAGGMAEVGKMAHDEYNIAPAGSVARQRILSSVLASLSTIKTSYTSEMLEDLDDADVLALFEKYAKEAGITNGDANTQAAAGHPANQGGAAPQEAVAGEEGEEEGEADGGDEPRQGGGYGPPPDHFDS
jgi:hypothetical protein